MTVDWKKVKRVLVVRLRSIGDTVLATPSLIALKRFLPDAQVDILLETWVAPLLDGFDAVDNVIRVGDGARERLAVANRIRATRYDVVFNLHGGTTATFFTAYSGAPYRIGYDTYQYRFLYNNRLSSAREYWNEESTHSAEQQLALLGFAGIPVEDRPKSRLEITDKARHSVDERLKGLSGPFALMHPAAAFATKQWSDENFARAAEFLATKGISTVAVAAAHEADILRRVSARSVVPVTTFTDLSLPEITALASKALIFIGNDSGIAHIAAAVETPTVVIFGSSNRDHWHPWTDAPNAIVYEEFPCQPCAGYECKQFEEPRCILSVKPEDVFEAIDGVLGLAA